MPWRITLPSTKTEFLAPTSIDEALQAISYEDAIFLGGGTSTALLYKTRLIEPSRVVWLGALRDLSGISISKNEIRIGSMVSMSKISQSNELSQLVPALTTAAGVIGNARVRAMATIGGALAHADPRQDVPPALIALDAVVATKSSGGSREVPLAEFYEGFLETVLAESELITEVKIPVVANRRSAYLRYTPTSEGDYPTVGVAASVTYDSNNKAIKDVRIVLCGVGQTPILATDSAQKVIEGNANPESLREAANLVKQAVDPHDDERGSADYKREMSEVFTLRALRECLA
jgi:carbon-monoxide dehydrogenase medium subunit